MIAKVHGKEYNIPNTEIKKLMNTLEISQTEAVKLWLADNDVIVNEEQQALDDKAKKVKIKHGAEGVDKTKKEKKPRTTKVSDEKKDIFQTILQNLQENYENVEILKENKLILVKIEEKTFKIDLIEQRKPKKV